jgi:hypothetical protein
VFWESRGELEVGEDLVRWRGDERREGRREERIGERVERG